MRATIAWPLEQGKLGDLAAFTSAIALAMIALLIGYENLNRLFNPVPIAFNEAIPIAILGLAVNLVTAFLLRDDHSHHHNHVGEHHHDDDEHGRTGEYHRDNNLRAAFVHVLADAAVSVLVIIGLFAGRQFGWIWMDPIDGSYCYHCHHELVVEPRSNGRRRFARRLSRPHPSGEDRHAR